MFCNRVFVEPTIRLFAFDDYLRLFFDMIKKEFEELIYLLFFLK